MRQGVRSWAYFKITNSMSAYELKVLRKVFNSTFTGTLDTNFRSVSRPLLVTFTKALSVFDVNNFG